MLVLGLTVHGPDASAALVRDGEVLSAVTEAALTRVPRDGGLPRRAARVVLREAGVGARQLDAVVCSHKPLRAFERVLATHLTAFPHSARSFADAMFRWLGERLWLRGGLARELGVPDERVLFLEHHLALAAGALATSPFPSAALLTDGGDGEWAALALARGDAGGVELLREVHQPHDPATLVDALAAFLGFDAPTGAERLAALATHGRPRHLDALGELLAVGEDGAPTLARELARHRFVRGGGAPAALVARFGPPRTPGEPLRAGGNDTRDADLAASLQALLEELLLALARALHARAPDPALCLAGELAHNPRAVARLCREGPFAQVWACPAPGGAAAALGAALHGQRLLRQDAGGDPDATAPARVASLALGPPAMDPEDAASQAGTEVAGEDLADDDAVVAALAGALRDGQVAGWVRGRLELSRHGLGGRALLAEPARPDAARRVAERVRPRDPLQPCGAAVAAEAAGALLELPAGCEAALRAGRLALPATPALRERAPAVVAADGTCRALLVDAAHDPALHALLLRCAGSGGLPVLLHSTLQLHGEPMVADGAGALRLFERSRLDLLVIERRAFRRD